MNGRDWRCRWGRHDWTRRRSQPGSPSPGFYLECRRCLKVRVLTQGSPRYSAGDMVGGGL